MPRIVPGRLKLRCITRIAKRFWHSQSAVPRPAHRNHRECIQRCFKRQSWPPHPRREPLWFMIRIMQLANLPCYQDCTAEWFIFRHNYTLEFLHSKRTWNVYSALIVFFTFYGLNVAATSTSCHVAMHQFYIFLFALFRRCSRSAILWPRACGRKFSSRGNELKISQSNFRLKTCHFVRHIRGCSVFQVKHFSKAEFFITCRSYPMSFLGSRVWGSTREDLNFERSAFALNIRMIRFSAGTSFSDLSFSFADRGKLSRRVSASAANAKLSTWYVFQSSRICIECWNRWSCTEKIFP